MCPLFLSIIIVKLASRELINRVFRENLLDPLEHLLRRGLRRHQKRRPEPDRQRQLAVMHERAGGHRGLPAAIGASIGEGFGLEQPGTAPTTIRADKSLG